MKASIINYDSSCIKYDNQTVTLNDELRRAAQAGDLNECYDLLHWEDLALLSNSTTFPAAASFAKGVFMYKSLGANPRHEYRMQFLTAVMNMYASALAQVRVVST